ncbi:hypothetical protein D5125_05545 [Magnetovirga frankeli]|uniref:hypothetical protein n=1 Tax=Magnetovirga frankeli TaxID=947516 RepID=UPI001293E87B|nr:hypothetical protein D5125_05545 [gamma proteobacterium SS-5]
MKTTDLNRYRRFLAFHRSAAGLLDYAPPLTPLMTGLGAWLHPAKKANRLPPEWAHRWWHYLRVSSYATALIYRIREISRLTDITWHDPDATLDAIRQKGGLILTYHHSFAYHLPALVGSQGIPLNILARSPSDNPLYEEYAAGWFADIEAFLNGGKWIFLSRDGHNPLHRVVRDLKAGMALVSLHDFPNYYARAKTFRATIQGRDIDAPVGMLDVAQRHGLPVSVGYVRWSGRRRLDVFLSSLNANGQEPVPVDVILTRYFRLLDGIIETEPEFWEGWAGLEHAIEPEKGI